MKLSSQEKRKVIQKLFDLFIIQNKKYLYMNKWGNYQTFNTFDNSNQKPLKFWQLEKHISNEFTIGTFAAYHSKFITFDIDVHDKLNAKWTAYYLIDILIKLGIPEQYIYISTSGNKGFHVDLYFNNPLHMDIIKDLYSIVMERIDFTYIKGEIELRPTTKQGVKLPLGTNFKNNDNKTNKCYYCDYENYLSPIEQLTYILDIEQININIIHDIIEREKDTLILDKNELKDNKQLQEAEETKIYIDTKYKPLQSYELYNNESITLEYIKQLEQKGLQKAGTRHNSLFSLSRYYKYLGCDQKENEQLLIEWMNEQDIRYYTTSINDCYTDISEIVEYIYKKDVSFITEQKEIIITYSEMLEILKAKTKNEKLLLYALLIHSKKYSDKNNVFYMSFNQMSQATSLVEKTCRNLINKLELNNFIIIVERDRKIKGTHSKKPNKYKLNISCINDNNYIQITDNVSYYDCVNLLIPIDELRELLPYKQFKDVKNVT